MNTIIRAPKGSLRREVKVNEVVVPDLWHIAMSLPMHEQQMVLECWHLCHDLLSNIIADQDNIKL